jgi:hypothetical protein
MLTVLTQKPLQLQLECVMVWRVSCPKPPHRMSAGLSSTAPQSRHGMGRMLVVVLGARIAKLIRN